MQVRQHPTSLRFFVVFAALVGTTHSSCTSSSAWRRKRQKEFERKSSATEDRKTPSKKKRSRGRRIGQGKALDKLARSLGARPKPLENRRALKRVFSALDELDRNGGRVVRFLQLGDSHIAADYITRTIRETLQLRFGDAGRGFVAVDQKLGYGGRRTDRKGWKRLRVVDRGAKGKPFGFAGMRIESTRRGAEIEFKLEEGDQDLAIFYHREPDGAPLKVYAEGEQIGKLSTRGSQIKSAVERIAIPEGTKQLEKLKIVAQGPGAKLFGLSFESIEAGVLFDSIGPVGADAKVYLNFNRRSLKQHLELVKPDLILLMVGGNDALAVRQGKRTLEEVRSHHERFIKSLQDYVPEADCLVWGPMDAGERKRGKVVTKSYITEIRDIQREVAKELGCAYWDTFDAMGGEGSFGEWLERGIMNPDMVHPRAKGGDLLGHLFSTAFMNAYLAGE